LSVYIVLHKQIVFTIVEFLSDEKITRLEARLKQKSLVVFIFYLIIELVFLSLELFISLVTFLSRPFASVSFLVS
jgi:hypothetical protein